MAATKKKMTAARLAQIKYFQDKKKREDKIAASRAEFKPLANPSPLQSAIFDDMATGAGHLVVEACAGSGKSTTLINSLLRIPAGKSIALCAFGRDPADELKARIPQLPNNESEVDTTHVFGGRALKRRFKGIILDKEKLQKIIIGEIGDPYVDPDNTNLELEEKLQNLSKCVSLAKQSLALTEDKLVDLIDKFSIEYMSEEERKHALASDTVDQLQREFIQLVLSIIEKCKRQTFTYDFDDMLFVPVILNLSMDQFDYVLPDEVQDFNACQMELIKRMCAPGGRIVAFGDRRQAIFLFRGADENSIPDLITKLGAKVLPLSITYRCAKSVIKYVTERISGLNIQAGPDNADGEVNIGISFDTLRDGVKPGDFVLSRLNAPLMTIALNLLRHNKPCQIRGKDIGNHLKYFIWKSKAKDIPSFVTWVDTWEHEQIELLQKRKRKPANMSAMIENVQDRSACLTMLALDCSSIKELSDKITRLFSDDDVSKDNPKFVSLSNIHKSKGLESDTVWMLESTFKPDRSIEESNLYYVACTRAKRVLNIVEGNLRDK